MEKNAPECAFFNELGKGGGDGDCFASLAPLLISPARGKGLELGKGNELPLTLISPPPGWGRERVGMSKRQEGRGQRVKPLAAQGLTDTP